MTQNKLERLYPTDEKCPSPRCHCKLSQDDLSDEVRPLDRAPLWWNRLGERLCSRRSDLHVTSTIIGNIVHCEVTWKTAEGTEREVRTFHCCDAGPDTVFADAEVKLAADIETPEHVGVDQIDA